MPRPRGFDSDHVVDRAMELFRTQGYDATSVSDLTAELGVHPGSLYRTFGDKLLVQGLQVVVKADPDPRRLLRSVDAVLSSLAGPEGLHPHGNE